MELRLHFLKTFFFFIKKKKTFYTFVAYRLAIEKTNKNPNFQILLKMFFSSSLRIKKKKKNPMYILKKEGLVYGVMKERDHDQTVDRMWGEG